MDTWQQRSTRRRSLRRVSLSALATTSASVMCSFRFAVDDAIHSTSTLSSRSPLLPTHTAPCQPLQRSQGVKEKPQARKGCEIRSGTPQQTMRLRTDLHSESQPQSLTVTVCSPLRVPAASNPVKHLFRSLRMTADSIWSAIVSSRSNLVGSMSSQHDSRLPWSSRRVGSRQSPAYSSSDQPDPSPEYLQKRSTPLTTMASLAPTRWTMNIATQSSGHVQKTTSSSPRPRCSTPAPMLRCDVTTCTLPCWLATKPVEILKGRSGTVLADHEKLCSCSIRLGQPERRSAPRKAEVGAVGVQLPELDFPDGPGGADLSEPVEVVDEELELGDLTHHILRQHETRQRARVSTG
eukprot:3606349-Rhodomonas_salina.1